MKVYVPRTVLLDGREVEALVPIEAEEEWAVSHDRDAPAWSSVTKERAQSPGVDETAFVRYVTPWTPTEEA